MKFTTFLIGCLVSASFFVSCNEATDDSFVVDETEQAQDSTTTDDWEPELYEASELVVLMRQIHDDQLAVKSAIIAGQEPGAMPDFYVEMHTAQSTEPDEINEVYHSLADKFIAEYEIMTNAESSIRAEKFNTVITTCISCHENYCQGPIPKIKKLYIK